MNTDGYVLYVIDEETTNLSHEKGDIIEISFCRLLPKGNDDYEEEQKTWFLKPLNPEGIDDEALRVNGHKREDILHQTQVGRDKYKDAKQVINEIELWLSEDGYSAMDRIWVGQNPMFDVNHLQALYKKLGIQDFPFAIGNGNRILELERDRES